MGWLHRFPVLIFIGAYILAYTAGNMLLQDAKFGPVISFLLPTLHTILPMLLGIIVVVTGMLKHRKVSAG